VDFLNACVASLRSEPLVLTVPAMKERNSSAPKSHPATSMMAPAVAGG
jgi:hypothetical protein